MEAGDTPVLVHNCDVATEDDTRLAMDRAEELQSGRNDYWKADKRGTTAVIGVWNSLEKKLTNRIGINGSGAMSENFVLREGQEFVQAAGHAEEGILNNLKEHEHAIFGAASRNFCNETCHPMILDPENLNVNTVEVGGEGIRGHQPQNSPYTLFWSPKG
ncbi:hypothetical protein [Streptomyces sp. NPDC047009]|uniref:hypothetical protein n=1 Tax=unclassified Streptomyces TaxID=2593676 RepID=UPI0033F77793